MYYMEICYGKMVWLFTFNQSKEAIEIHSALKCIMRCLKPLALKEARNMVTKHQSPV